MAAANQTDNQAYYLRNRLAAAIGDNPHPGSLSFYTKLVECAELHSRKQKDYGREKDPFANVRSADEFDISPWKGAILRGNDKMSRIKTFASTGTLCNEGVEDSFMDLAVYSLIALVLFQQAIKSVSDKSASDTEVEEFLRPASGDINIALLKGSQRDCFAPTKTTSPIGQ